MQSSGEHAELEGTEEMGLLVSLQPEPSQKEAAQVKSAWGWQKEAGLAM